MPTRNKDGPTAKTWARKIDAQQGIICPPVSRAQRKPPFVLRAEGGSLGEMDGYASEANSNGCLTGRFCCLMD